MEVFEAIKERRSVRKYSNCQVPEEILQQIIETARLAPSAGNRQDWRFIIVQDKEQRDKLLGITGQSFMETAPIIIAGVSLNPTRKMSCEVPAYAVDLAIAMTNITLMATANGLGICWIGAFNQDQAKTVLKIPNEYIVVQLMTLGYPADEPGVKIRKPASEVISYDYFS